MDLPEQPPPDAPAPPPGPQALRSRRVMRRIIVAGVLSIIGLLMVPMIAVVFRRTSRTVDRTEANHNARVVHLALFNFDSDYGKFPDASTIAAVQADTGTTVPLGSSSSNEIFRQLLVTVAKSESIFWASSSLSPRKPDNNIVGSEALKKGECAFAYVAGLSSSSDVTTPVLMTPVDSGKRRFERRSNYQNMAVILFVDGSVKILPIDRHGKVQINGIDIFDPRQPFWGGKAPDIKWPE